MLLQWALRVLPPRRPFYPGYFFLFCFVFDVSQLTSTFVLGCCLLVEPDLLYDWFVLSFDFGWLIRREGFNSLGNAVKTNERFYDDAKFKGRRPTYACGQSSDDIIVFFFFC